MRHLHLYQTVGKNEVVFDRGKNAFDYKAREYKNVTQSSLNRIENLKHIDIPFTAGKNVNNASQQNPYPDCVKYSYIITK